MKRQGQFYIDESLYDDDDQYQWIHSPILHDFNILSYNNSFFDHG